VVRTDFGLANLPGCQLNPATGSVGERHDNLRALQRFGCVAAQIAAAEKGEEDTPAGALPDALPVDAVLAAEEKQEPPAPPAAPLPTPLPLPPEGAKSSGWLGQMLAWSDWAGAAGALVAVGLGLGDGRIAAGRLWQIAFEGGLLPALLAAFFLWRGVSALLLRRTLQQTPVSRIRSLATGMVEISGRAVRRYALVSPVTQLPCVYYELRRFRRDDRDRWRQVARSSSGCVPFAVADGTGEVLVDPRHALIRPGVREEGWGNGGIFFVRGRDADERWIEETIPEGATVHVLGFANVHRERRPSLRERTAERLRLLKGSGELLARFDKNGDKRIDEEEWEEARRTIQEEASHAHLAEQGRRRRQEEHLVVEAPPRRGVPFIVAQTLDEAQLLRRLGWRVAVCLLLAASFFGWSFWQLMTYLIGTSY